MKHKELEKLEWEVWLEPLHEIQAAFRLEEDARQWIVDTMAIEKYAIMTFQLVHR